MTDKILVLTTCDSAEEAGRIASALVEERLAACVNVTSAIQSVYRWKGAVETNTEVMLLIKTSRALLADVRLTLERLHSYELPECIAVPVVDGSEAYLDWFDRALKQTEDSPR